VKKTVKTEAVETPVEKLASDAIEKNAVVETAPSLPEEDLDRGPEALEPSEEVFTFEKPVTKSEKTHFEKIVKSNKETIASLREQVIETRKLLSEANEKLELLKAK
jgi:hypothetical protein